jgi:hypothetical protein
VGTFCIVEFIMSGGYVVLIFLFSPCPSGEARVALTFPGLRVEYLSSCQSTSLIG